MNNKNYLSIVGSTSILNLERLVKDNFDNSQKQQINGFFNIAGCLSNENPLFKCFILSNRSTSIFLQGFFYRIVNEKDIKTVLDSNSDSKLDDFLNKLNGSFIAVITNQERNEISIVTDTFSFEKVFYTISNGEINISSFIWPLIGVLQKPIINKDAIFDILCMGFPLHDSTILKDVFVCEPGTITTFNYVNKEICKRSYTVFHKDRYNQSVTQNKKDFLQISKNHFGYIESNFKSTSFGATMTGGNDTRVVLNSMLNNNIKPFCISGFHHIESRDSLRSAKICKHYDLPFKVINYSVGINEIIDDVIYLSNGYTNGTWMANIAKTARNNASVMYYGFSGDYLAGGNEFIYDSLNIDEIVELSLVKKSFFKEIHPVQLQQLFGQDDQKFRQRYFETFNQFRSLPIEDMVFMQEKNQKDFKRTSSFADGTRIGGPSILFFHDREIVDFYRSINPKLFRQQLLHHKLLANKLPFLGWMPSANKTELPAFVIPYLTRVIPENLLGKLHRIINSRPKRLFFNNKEELLNFINQEDAYRTSTKITDYLELGDLLMHIQKEGMTEHDATLLKMRIHDICLSIDKVFSMAQKHSNHVGI